MYECQKYDVTYGENNSIYRIRFDRYEVYENKLLRFDKQHATLCSLVSYVWTKYVQKQHAFIIDS